MKSYGMSVTSFMEVHFASTDHRIKSQVDWFSKRQGLIHVFQAVPFNTNFGHRIFRTRRDTVQNAAAQTGIRHAGWSRQLSLRRRRRLVPLPADEAATARSLSLCGAATIYWSHCILPIHGAAPRNLRASGQAQWQRRILTVHI